ncbi:cubilin-like [Ptychodera flava]|uniref:cubilin-like n=1 Tax=Ptychodera flava TaxID=63121 RepID=UPI003969F806
MIDPKAIILLVVILIITNATPDHPIDLFSVRKPPSSPPEPIKYCGGNYTAKSDSLLVITSPNYPDNYDNNRVCEWFVKASDGNNLVLYLRDLRTEFLFDWLDIGEGFDPDDLTTREHRMSGYFRPWEFWESSTDEVWIRFTTDFSITWPGFMIEIVENVRDPVPTEKPLPTVPPEVTPECGGNITLTQDESRDVMSPNYPEDYDNDQECLWLIQTIPTHRIEITFEDFETERCHDWLDIGHGLDNNDLTTSELHLSGSLSPDTFESITNEAWMLFTSDYSITEKGFHVVVKDIGPPACGGALVISEPYGSVTIRSPNYPSNYPDNEICKWTVTGPPDQYILMKINDFETEQNFDWLEIGEGANEVDFSTTLYRLSGSRVTGSYATVHNGLWVLFTSDNSITARGFDVTFVAVDPCGDTYTTAPGSISSPLHPDDPYPHSSSCIWIIDLMDVAEVEVTYRIRMSFSEFDLEETYDKLLIGDGIDPAQGASVELSGSTLPKDVITAGTKAWLWFTSDNSIHGAGFHLTYSVFNETVPDPKPCGGTYSVKPGHTLVIESPNYPQDYSNNERCLWNVTTESGLPMVVAFLDFQTEEGFDWVDIGNGPDYHNISTRVRHESGTTLPGPFYSQDDEIWITFYTDYTIVMRGFVITVAERNDTDPSEPKPPPTATASPADCGSHEDIAEDETVDIYSPNYPDNYNDNDYCEWTITSTSGKRIRVTYLDFETEPRLDYLEIGRGHEIADITTLLRHHHGSLLPDPFTTDTDRIWLKFVSDHSVTYKGFHVRLKDNDCINNLIIPDGGSVTVDSPNYGSANYDDNYFCEWIIQAQQGQAIRIEVVDFKTEALHDWVDIGSGLESTDPSTRFVHVSGNVPPAMHLTSNSSLWVTFQSDATINYEGFRLVFYDDGCVTETYTNTSGEILSPLHPENYPNNADCVSLLSMPDERGVKLTFNHFRLETGHDFLFIGIGNDPNSTPTHIYTGTEPRDDLIFYESEIWLRFRSDRTGVDTGFNITYTAICPQGYEYHIVEGEERCYKFVADPKPWYGGREDCLATLHGELVIIDSQEELEFVSGKMNSVEYWIGYTDLSVEGRWRWLNCRDSSEWDLGNWAPGQPTNGTDEDCAITNSNNKWEDRDCNNPLPYVCKIYFKDFDWEDINVQAVYAEALSPYDVHVTWNVSEYNCDVIGYRVRYRRYDWLGGYFYEYVAGGDSDEITLTNLESSTRYVVYVAGVTSRQRLSYVGPAYAQTHEVVKPPEPPVEPDKPCGGNYSTKDGNMVQITSPNYPDRYDHNSYCEWYVEGSTEGKVLIVHIRDFVTERWFDVVDIGEGSDNSDRDSVVHSVSGFIAPFEYWTSSTHQIWLTFTTDSSFRYRGFLLEIEEVDEDATVPTPKPQPTDDPPAVVECGSNHTIPANGYLNLTSPNYPDNYDNDMNCVWYYQTETGNRIDVTFIFFDTEYCHDYFEVGNGANHMELSTSIVRVSGDYSSEPPNSVTSIGDRVWVTFTSDYSGTRQGFYVMLSEITEEPDCGESLTLPASVGSSVAITSPNYPDNYDDNEHCLWNIDIDDDEGTPNLHIYIHVTELDTEMNFDWLEVGAGSNELDFSSTLYRFSGNQQGESYFTDKTELWSLWTSDLSITGKGFNVTYFTADPCGGHLTAPNDIRSPLYPMNYPHGSHCSWMIHVNSGSFIEITFRDFHLEDGYDYLYIYEGSSEDASTVVELTGEDLPKTTIINSDTALLVFTADTTISGSGFDLSFKEYTEDILPAKPCGGNLEAKHDSILVIQSPNYPSNYYDSDHCRWNITSPENTRMTVTFRDFMTEDGYDWVDVGDGLDDSDIATRILHHSGDKLPSLLVSMDTELWISFITDEDINYRGFLLQIEVVNITDTSEPKPTVPPTPTPVTPPVCGEHIIVPADGELSVTSPNYPSDYDNNLHCEWTVNTTTPGRRIRVIFYDFYTEHRFDYLELGDGLDSTLRRSRVRRESGSRLPRPHTTLTDKMWLVFITDESVTYPGFRLTLQEEQDCLNENVRIPLGGMATIQSPYYPNLYDHNTFCEWKITAETGQNIHAVVIDFDTEPYYDFVDVGSGDNPLELTTRMLHASGSHDATTFYTGTDQIWMTFRTDNTIVRNGFQIDLYDDGCQRVDFDSYPGVIKSPNHPSDYPNHADCVWTISLGENQRIKITFNDFNLETDYDKLLIGEGTDPTSDQYVELTGPDLPDPIVSSGNEMWLRFKTDWSIVKSGFNLTFDFECLEGYEKHWVGNQERCYKFVSDPKPWDEGREDCLATENGDLVIINDQVELDYVSREMNTNKYWIGYSDRSVEGRWRWVDCRDSSEWDLSNWADGQPSNGTDEDCAVVDDENKWQDEICADLFPYVCELNPKDFDWEDINVQAVYAEALSPYDVHVTWDVSDYNCDVIGYRVRYRRYDWLGGYFYEYVAGGDSDEVTLTNLESSTRYVVYVAGVTSRQVLSYVGPAYAITHEVIKPAEPTEPSLKPCGANYTTKEDSAFVQITSPNYPDDYDNDEYCEWYITASSPSSTLIVHLRDLRTETWHDWLEIGEGNDNSDSDTIEHRISGFFRPFRMWQSQTDMLWITFTSDQSITFRGFLLEIEESQADIPTDKPMPTEAPSIEECGGNLTIPADGYVDLTSPGYPDNYADDLSCVWLITTDSELRINATFIDIETEWYFDWVELGNGLDHTDLTTSQLRVSGNEIPNPLYSTGDKLWVTFTTDANINMKGFHLILKEISLEDDPCRYNVVIDSEAGEIVTSPGYPEQYNNDELCVGTVSVSPAYMNKHIYLSINSFDTEEHYDLLHVGTVEDDVPNLLFLFSGSSIMGTYATAEDSLQLLWSTDSDTTKEGFSITFKAVDPCGDTLIGPSGNISSPIFPTNYPHASDCLWNIQVSEGMAIQLTFHVFDLEESFDFLHIGASSSVSPLVELTGSELPKVEIIEDSSAWLRFTSDLSVDGAGFYVTYEEYSEEIIIGKECGGNLTSKLGSVLVVQSPNHPSNYFDSDYCLWNITASDPDNRMFVFFRYFTTELGHDWLEIGNGLDETDLSTRFRRHSGPSRPTEFVSQTNELWMTFTTDYSINYRGFLIFIEERNDTDTTTPRPPLMTTPGPPLTTPVYPTTPTPICGGHHLVPSVGVIQVESPNYPNDYDNDLLCEWTFETEGGKRIRVDVLDFKTEKRYDYLDFGDGLDLYDGDSKFRRLDGNEKAHVFTTVTNELWMKFVTDHRKTYRGFSIELSEENDCFDNRTISTGGTQVVTSPNYSDDYNDDEFCEWLIDADPSKNIRVLIKDFRTENNYDWLDIGYGSNSMDGLTRIIHESGNHGNKQYEFYAQSNLVWMTFYTDYRKTYRGFEVELDDSGCVREELTDRVGSITSANYPDDYPHNCDCVWQIVMNEGQQVQIEFQHFDLERNYDWLLIGEGTDPESDQYTEYTGNRLPDDYVSESHQVWLRFKTDLTKTKKGFELTYEVFECPEGYEPGYNFGCYKFIGNHTEWKDARDECQKTADSDLVIIEDEDELAYLVDRVGSDLQWIGYSDIAERSQWVWVDCSPSSGWHDDNWKSGEPSGDGRCVALDNGEWNALMCTDMHPFICEITKKPFNASDVNVEAVYGTALSPYSISVSWDIPQYYCDIAGYKVRYHRRDFAGGVRVINVEGGTSDYTEIEGLEPSTLYYIYVAAVTIQTQMDYVPGDPVMTHEVVKPPEPPMEPGKPCGGNYTTKNDTVLRITSPNYPDNYDNNEYCEWIIDTTYPGSSFLVHLRDLKTERWYDWLDIGEGDDIDDEATRVHHLSGRVRPWLYWSSESDQLWITFYTDSDVTYRGFVLEIEEIVAEEPPTQKPLPTEPVPSDPVVECGGNITILESGQVDIRSPNYPEDYTNNLYCLWLVETNSRLRIDVAFVDFETEPYNDWVEIGNGYDHEDLTTSALRVSGSQNDVPDNHESAGFRIWITFTTDYSRVFRGFHLRLTEITEPDECGEDYIIDAVVGSSVTILSPNYPDNYNNDDLCRWTIRIAQSLQAQPVATTCTSPSTVLTQKPTTIG